ncbi:ENTH-domain-containing protein [Phanerochaete sordida]|uniref:ENTH-domain-containing protein n=1 Tax=Phanerochaete sordida TaxID=48140 RepID=A0A9P3GE19_9APHY|nr:ENTH-domain-containing protein [Phanerochaete sordida]
MDRLESLGNTLSNLTMYDIKSMYNQAKNVVLNVSEMEAKVREATNDEPWGASSTLMQEIAQGTFNFQNFNEIMPCIYARFMEKEAKQWRQIYKALQLLEYLVKNGSERVVDDARSHIATIKMLRNFYYIDEKGKDQGLNVRNRSKELVELLSDVEKIRTERRKAKTNKSKYTGVGNDGMSFSSGGSRYGGFGSDSLGYGGSSSGYGGGGSGSFGGDYSSRDYNDYSSGGGGGGGGSSSGGFRDTASRKNFEEYDAGDDDVVSARRSNSLRGSASSPAPRRRGTGTPSTPVTPAAPEKPKASQPVPDLLGLDDDDFAAPVAAPPAPSAPKAQATTAPALDLVDDDFDDFQAAPPSAGPAATFLGSTPAAPAKATSPPLPQQANANLFNMLSPATTSSPPPMQASRAPSYMGAGMGSTMTPAAAPNYTSPIMTANAPARQSSFGGVSTAPTTPAARPASSAGGFDDLWSMSLGSSAPKPQQSSGPAKSIQDLQKEKAQAAIWGQGQQARPPMAAGFGSFGSAPASGSSNAAPPSSSGNGIDDLLF